MTHLMYPDDGGLGEQVRPLGDSFSGFDVLKEHFAPPTVKDHVRGKARFEYFRDSALWYRTDSGFLFPVPLQDIGTTTFDAEYKAIRLMRWIRLYMETLNDQA